MTKIGNIVFSNGLFWMSGTICSFSVLCVNELKGNEELLPQESWRQPHEIPACTYPVFHSPCSTSTSHWPTSQHTPIWNLLCSNVKSLNLSLSHFFIHKVQVLFSSLHELSQGLIS